MAEQFQSSPGPRGPGVGTLRTATAMIPVGFNPRPALAGRASVIEGRATVDQQVSILARPSRAGRRW